MPIDFAAIYSADACGDDSQFCDDDLIKPERRLSRRPDINAFLLLDRLVPGKLDIICHSEHDEITLDIDVDELNKVGTEEDALDLIRCGVRYDGGCLRMFV
jgi:hypothetical protein